MNKKILIITPKFPIPTTGACEQERLAGMLQLKRLGFDVRVIGRIFEWQNEEEIIKWGREHDVKIDVVPYEFSSREKSSIFKKIRKLLNPIDWDGSAYEYTQANIKQLTIDILQSWQPDAAWFDYTYLWPLYQIFKAKNIPIITRSINFEAIHFLHEDGRSLINYLKFLPKFFSELKIVKKSDYVFSITPAEEKLYKKLGAKNIDTLPLRSLPALVKQRREIREPDVLHLFFMGASYNVSHNYKAAELIIKEIAPEVERRAPGKFFFHILGKKLPENLAKLCLNNIKEEGFVENLEQFLVNEVDIAVIPSIMGAGMQQKIFEPLVYGIPTVTSKRGLAGYPYENGKHVLCAKNKDEFVEQLLKLKDRSLRKKLSANALRLSSELFARERLNTIVQQAVRDIT
ncbi:MAG: glycosyltransferase [bacterium]|nr:glycosyltransferase [bacterium]